MMTFIAGRAWNTYHAGSRKIGFLRVSEGAIPVRPSRIISLSRKRIPSVGDFFPIGKLLFRHKVIVGIAWEVQSGVSGRV